MEVGMLGWSTLDWMCVKATANSITELKEKLGNPLTLYNHKTKDDFNTYNSYL